MTERILDEVNADLPQNRQHDMRLFNHFVHIQRHNATEEAAERVIDRKIPRRRILRRHSTMNLGEVVQPDVADVADLPDQNLELAVQNDLPAENVELPEQNARKKRRASVDARIYLAPPEIRSAIQTLRQSDGV